MTAFKWNWQHKNWPKFTYDETALKELEYEFIQSSGLALGAFKHVSDDEKEQLLIEVLSDEALKTSEIEGEYLDRDSIQESIKRNLGLTTENRKLPAAEFGLPCTLVLFIMLAVKNSHITPIWQNIFIMGRICVHARVYGL